MPSFNINKIIVGLSDDRDKLYLREQINNLHVCAVTYSKVIDDRSVTNLDPVRNKIETRHVTGTNYTDVFITCLLDYGEPQGQDAFDNTTNNNAEFVFDELGLRSYSPTGAGKLLTHVIFHPVQKSLNRLIQVDYTVRIQSLSGLSEVA
jgi:hypothetical protein